MLGIKARLIRWRLGGELVTTDVAAKDLTVHRSHLSVDKGIVVRGLAIRVMSPNVKMGTYPPEIVSEAFDCTAGVLLLLARGSRPRLRRLHRASSERQCC